MRKGIFSLLFCTFVFLSLPVLAQQSTLLEKYRTMALDYNHDLKAAEKNIAASMEVEKSARADLKPKLSVHTLIISLCTQKVNTFLKFYYRPLL